MGRGWIRGLLLQAAEVRYLSVSHAAWSYVASATEGSGCSWQLQCCSVQGGQRHACVSSTPPPLGVGPLPGLGMNCTLSCDPETPATLLLSLAYPGQVRQTLWAPA
jgi:hypothetical protein